jgi:uncharacterized protein (DUF2267 family)
MMKYEQYAYEAGKFTNEVAIALGDPENTDQADRIMTAVMHALRELLTPEESLHLISQLPMLIKAIYVNGWHISGNKKRIHSMEEFIECLMLQNPRTAAQDFGNDEKAIARTKAVFQVLKNHVSAGEVKDIIAQMPDELTALWVPQQETEVAHAQRAG